MHAACHRRPAETAVQLPDPQGESGGQRGHRFRRGARFPYNPQVLQPARAGPLSEGKSHQCNATWQPDMATDAARPAGMTTAAHGADAIERQKRRRFLVSATATIGGIGAIAAATPFVMSFWPSERAKAAGAPVEVDISKVEPGQKIN